MVSDSLLFQYLDGELNSKEIEEIKFWLDMDPENLAHFRLIKSNYESQSFPGSSEEMNHDWMQLQTRIEGSDSISKPGKKIRISNIMRAAAAIIILAIGTGLILQLQNDVTTIRGNSEEPISAFLPDGSEVTLTKGSRISYSKNFNQELREVSISGEAFFSVTSDHEHPFIVNTGEAKIRVTGTSFLVNCADRNNDDVEVIVKSGKVLFYNSETFSANSFKVDLGPGDKGIYSAKLNQLNKSRDNNYKDLYVN